MYPARQGTRGYIDPGRGYGASARDSLLGGMGNDAMSTYESNLMDDGTVFPPVTPDPPLPPGQEEIYVPEMVPVSDPDGPDHAEE